MSDKKPFRLAFVVFLMLMFMTGVLWAFYMKSDFVLERDFFGYSLFFFGTLFSLMAGIAIWSIESRQDYLEREVKTRLYSLIEKNKEADRLHINANQFYDTCKQVFSKVSVTEVLEHVMDLVQSSLRADEGSLMLLEADGRLAIAASRGMSDEVVARTYIKMGERISGRAAQERQEFLINGDLGDYPLFQGIEGNPLIKSSIICPICFQDEVLGVLNINRTDTTDRFTKHDLRNASLFASLVGQAIKNAQMYEDLSEKIGELQALYKTFDITKERLIQNDGLGNLPRGKSSSRTA